MVNDSKDCVFHTVFWGWNNYCEASIYANVLNVPVSREVTIARYGDGIVAIVVEKHPTDVELHSSEIITALMVEKCRSCGERKGHEAS